MANVTDEAWQTLVAAVVAMALRDYEHAKDTLKRHPKHEDSLKTKEEVERFFRSGRFSLFADFNEGVLDMAKRGGFRIDG